MTLYGQDIEDPKGDVFGLTRGLSTSFRGRVTNAPLSESTIVGVSVGRALAGGRPIACIQFADFLPLAWNQILSELGSMYWRTNGGWECPVIVAAPCGGYRPGLGPFHAQTLESSLAHIPGIDVLMPSSAGDAAGLLNAALRSRRPTLFLYPKVCLNDPDRSTSSDTSEHIVPIGKARFLQRGNDLSIVTWGSTVPVCEQAVETLAGAGVGVDLIDLRSISPWDKSAVARSLRKTGKLLAVHEDNLTCGFGAEVVAATVEAVGGDVVCRRLARADTYVPCNPSNQLEVLPSYKSVLEAAADLVGHDLSWQVATHPESTGRLYELKARGPSPADQSVTVVEWRVAPGARVEAGDVVGEAEADKAVFEIKSPVAGVVANVLVSPGATVRVGTGLLQVEVTGKAASNGTRGSDCDSRPRLQRRTLGMSERSTRPDVVVSMSRPCCVVGSVDVDNAELASRLSRPPEEIFRLTGIDSRHRLSSQETVLDLALRAAARALDQEGLSLDEIDSVVCSTTTPLDISPSMACRVLDALCENGSPREIPAYDVSAACSGYLYALAAGHDFVRAHPERKVLVVTAEALSTIIDPGDPDTSILFGDAASATVIGGPGRGARAWQLVRRPVVSACGEDGTALRVPHRGVGFLEMKGKRVFGEAVRKMLSALHRACEEAGLRIDDLAWVVPHQANGRIIDALRSRLPLDPARVVSAIRYAGNTSSTSIPLSLEQIAGRLRPGQRIGLCAFGAGFTFGAAVLEVQPWAPDPV